MSLLISGSVVTETVFSIPGVGQRTVQKLLKEFGSSELVRAASEDQLTAVVGRAAAKKVRTYYQADAGGVVR